MQHIKSLIHEDEYHLADASGHLKDMLIEEIEGHKLEIKMIQFNLLKCVHKNN